MPMKWGTIHVPRSEVCLDYILHSGQTFRWVYNETCDEYTNALKLSDFRAPGYGKHTHGINRKIKNENKQQYISEPTSLTNSANLISDDIFRFKAKLPPTPVKTPEATPLCDEKIGLSSNRYIVVVLKQADDHIRFASVGNRVPLEDLQAYLENYFRLDVRLTDEWISFAKLDKRFKSIKPEGIRQLALDPWETLISFICSTNNNISRITQMCHNMSKHFGNLIDSYNGVSYYSFPSSGEIISRASEAKLRDLGFGYRSKYIINTAHKIVMDKKTSNIKEDSDFLLNMVAKGYNFAQMREVLLSYDGIGGKVAACICLMALYQDHIVPMDVHLSRIAKRDYGLQANKIGREYFLYHTQDTQWKNTKKKVNWELDILRIQFWNIWGPLAGWMQTVLFTKEIGKSVGMNSEGEIVRRDMNLSDSNTSKSNSHKVNHKEIKRDALLVLVAQEFNIGNIHRN